MRWNVSVICINGAWALESKVICVQIKRKTKGSLLNRSHEYFYAKGQSFEVNAIEISFESRKQAKLFENRAPERILIFYF